MNTNPSFTSPSQEQPPVSGSSVPEGIPSKQVTVAEQRAASCPPSQGGLWDRWRRWFIRNVVEPLVSSRNPPWFDARGAAVGLAIGFMIPVGGQLVCLGLLRTLLRFNVMVAVAFTFVSNPIDMIPLYYGYYYLGSLILHRPVSMHFESFNTLMHPIMNKTWFWEAMGAFFELGKEFLVRWTAAAVLLAAIFAPLGYFVTLHIQKRRCRRAAQNMGIAYESYLRELERKIKGESQ